MEQLKELLKLSMFIGQNVPCWNQGFGSNLSYKIDKNMYIKSTGKRLDQLSNQSDIALVNWQNLARDLKADISEEQYKNYLNGNSDTSWGRPSMESAMHSTSHRWVMHFHSVTAVLVAHYFFHEQRQSIEKTLNTFDTNYAFIKKVKPGLELYRSIEQIDHNVEIIFIENHGVLLRSDDNDVLKKYEKIEQVLIHEFQWDLSTLPLALSPLKAYFPDTAVYWSEILNHLVQMKDLFTLNEQAPQHLKEIWLAQAILFKNCPSLNFYDENECAEINRLPVEQQRLKVAQS